MLNTFDGSNAMVGNLMLDIAGTTLSAEDESLLTDPHIGGVILFARNVESPEQVRALTDSIRRINANLLIAVDQEGGRVARFRQGFSALPAMGKLGEVFDQSPIHALELAFASGYVMATEVLAVGVDFSFAPVLDVNGVSQVIGDRAFHAHPVAITALSAAFIRGMKAAGMASTGKHFPGHGSVTPDSHVAAAIDTRSYDEIYRHDMQPFIANLPLLDALMPAHVIFEQIDDKPAGFSSVWIDKIIRQHLGFDGVIFSDDLSMKAAHVAGDAGDRLIAALSAGCDMGLVCNDREAALIALERLASLACTPNMPQQTRIAKMKATLPNWQGSLQATASQSSYWQGHQQAIEHLTMV